MQFFQLQWAFSCGLILQTHLAYAHGPLADHVGGPALAIADEELDDEESDVDEDQAEEAVGVTHGDVVVDGDFGEVGPGLPDSGGDDDQDPGEGHPAPVGFQVAQKTGEEPGIDISDVVFIVDYMFNEGDIPFCFDESDVDASGGMDISDVVYMVDYMFNDGAEPVSCF